MLGIEADIEQARRRLPEEAAGGLVDDVGEFRPGREIAHVDAEDLAAGLVDGISEAGMVRA